MNEKTRSLDQALTADLLVAQLADLADQYNREQAFSEMTGHTGPMDREAVPVPVELLQAALQIREQNTSKELEAVRLLMRALWRTYDSGGHSMGRSLQARMVEAMLMLMGPPSSASAQYSETSPTELVGHIEEHAYKIRQTESSPDEWDKCVEAFRAAVDNRKKMMAPKG